MGRAVASQRHVHDGGSRYDPQVFGSAILHPSLFLYRCWVLPANRSSVVRAAVKAVCHWPDNREDYAFREFGGRSIAETGSTPRFAVGDGRPMIRALLSAYLLLSLVAFAKTGAVVVNPLVETLVLFLVLGLSVGGLIQSRPGVERLPRALALLPMASIVPIWRLSRHTIGHPVLNAAILLTGVVLLVAAWKVFPCTGGRSAPSAIRSRWRIAATVLAVSGAMIASAVARNALSTPVWSDTISYWLTSTSLFERQGSASIVRTSVYPAVIATVHGLGGTGDALILVQAGLRAVSCGLVAWLLCSDSLFAGTFIGLVLALDPISAAASVCYLTESLFTSALTLGLALVVRHLSGTTAPSSLSLVFTGMALGLGLSLRPVGLGLVLPALLAYGVRMRSLRVPLKVAGGFALVVAGQMAFNFLRTGRFLLVSSGIFFAFPLFIHNLFDSQNGPASMTLGREMERCGLQKAAAEVTTNQANAFVHFQLGPCLSKAYDGAEESINRLYGAAYGEAFRSHPLVFSRAMAGEAAYFLGSPAATSILEMASFSDTVNPIRFCKRLGAFRGHPEALVDFVCPLPRADVELRSFVIRFAGHLLVMYQPYLPLHYPDWQMGSIPSRTVCQEAGLGAIAFFLVVVGVVSPRQRLWAAGAATIIVVIALTTAYGQVTLLRYVSVLSPLLLLISGLGVSACVERLHGILGPRETR